MDLRTVAAAPDHRPWGPQVISHMMPNLPNVTMERDLACFKEFFENPDFRVDGLKLYPTLVIRGTGLYELWKAGLYRNYDPSELVELIAHVLALVPPWTRVYRVQRDIPMPLVTSGVDTGNLRELAMARMRELGLKCRDVRTREVCTAAPSVRRRGSVPALALDCSTGAPLPPPSPTQHFGGHLGTPSTS